MTSRFLPRRHSRAFPRAAGVLAGYCADQVFGDPRTSVHPVAWFGSWANFVQSRLYADSRARGVLYTALTLAPWVAGAGAVQRWSLRRRLPIAEFAATAAVTWACLGARSLEREAMAVHDLLLADDVCAARERIRSLVGRDTSTASADDLARAVVESLAENQSDAVSATLVWAALTGPVGAVLHRASNTLDAMVGYRSERYANFGWASARLDDVLNAVPARVSLAATLGVTAASDGVRAATQVRRLVRRDAPAHPSPNAGLVEAAAAGALGVRLGGANTYGGVVEDRGTLGDGRPVEVSDIARAVTLERRVALSVVAASVSTLLLGAAMRAAAMRGRLRAN